MTAVDVVVALVAALAGFAAGGAYSRWIIRNESRDLIRRVNAYTDAGKPW